MRREPGLTLRGALLILGHREPGLIAKLDTLLGGVILAAGAGAGLAAVGAPVLTPLAALAAVWGWLGQKDEAIKLLRQTVNSVSGTLSGLSGYERRQLIAAAHSSIVIAAFFESLRERLGKDLFELLQITEAEKKMLASGGWPTWGEPLIDSLYYAEIPAPSAIRGYEDNVEMVKVWARRVSDRVDNFIRGLKAGQNVAVNWQPILESVSERYRSYYLTLAASVPEFMVWATLGEHAATRSQILNLRSDMRAALDANRHALGRVQKLLALQATESHELTDQRLAVARANRGVLDQPIVPMDAERYGAPVEFPKVSRIYVNPRYRITQANEDARPADEKWWRSKSVRNDIDLTLAAYVMAPDAARLPLLLLGHPGAGKSLLTKVIAARLPSTAYTVVRVPLRQVAANAPIIDQVQQALDLATHRRVDWWQLVEQSHSTVRVVLLDGLDELLQASSSDRSGYLQDVMEFQRVEAEQERPVIVVVTSRTVVADRVDIPAGTTVVKLDYFNEADIENWLHHWHEANAPLIASGAVRELTAAAALRQPELARQPLLLLMLALYSADPAFPALDADLSTANLYQRLLDNFARREVAKKAKQRLSADEMDRRARDQLEQLSVAALAMFNRKRLSVADTELGGDMAALNDNLASNPAELGQRLIGEFFFVHAAEARPLGSSGHADDASVVRSGEATRRSYEFLHATFGEYLVASRVLNELVDVAETALAGRRGPREPDDDLLFALLSHQPLAGRRSTVSFATELFANLSLAERNNALAVLAVLIKSYRRRYTSDRYLAYRPTPLDRIRQLSVYSANLITLRVALEPGGFAVPLREMLLESENPLPTWRSTVNLWRSGLDADGFQAVIATLSLSGGAARFAVNREISGTSEMLDVWSAQLVDDKRLEDQLRFGMAVNDHIFYTDEERNDWADMMASWLVPYIAGVSRAFIIKAPSQGTSSESISRIAALLVRLLKFVGGDLEFEASVVRLLLALPKVFEIDTHALSAAVIRHPTLVSMVPELQDPTIFGGSWNVMCMSLPTATIWKSKGGPEGLTGELALWNWRSHYLQRDSLPEGIEPAIDELLKSYFGEMPDADQAHDLEHDVGDSE